MKKCKIAIENEAPCQMCCCFCDEKKDTCPDACGEAVQGDDCPELIEEETELQVMESAVPDVLKAITDITVQKKKLDEQEKLMKKKLQEAMEQYGVKKFENDQVAFTYVPATTRTTIDSEKLKKMLPEVYKFYSKTTNVSASVRIKVK